MAEMTVDQELKTAKAGLEAAIRDREAAELRILKNHRGPQFRLWP